MSAYHGTAVPLGTSATPHSAHGFCGFATSPGSLHGFSASRATWTTIPLYAPIGTIFAQSQGGCAAVRAGNGIHCYSARTGTFTSTLVSPTATVIPGRDVSAIQDGTTVKLFSSTQGTLTTIDLGTTSYYVGVTDYTAVIDTFSIILPFSGPRGAFGAPDIGASLGPVGANQCVVLTPSTVTPPNVPLAVYSAFTNAWTPTPPGTSANTALYTSGYSTVLADPSGLYGLASTGDSWAHLAVGMPQTGWTSGANVLLQDGNMLHTFNPHYEEWATTVTNQPVTQTNLHDTTLIAVDGDGLSVHAFSNYTNHWSSHPLAAPLVSFLAEKQSAFACDGTAVYAFSGIGQVSSANEYPDWNRMNTRGGLFLLNVAGEAGAWALTAMSLGRANNPTSIGYLYLDIPTLFVLSADTIPSSGVLRYSYLMPDSPALMGVTLYFQSGIVAPSSTYLTDFAQATVF